MQKMLIGDFPCYLEFLIRRLWSYKISKDKCKRLFLSSKGISVEEFETLKASSASLEEQLRKNEAQLKSCEEEKGKLEEEKEKLSSSLKSVMNIAENEKSQKLRYEELLGKKDEKMAALNRSIIQEQQKSLDAGMHLVKEKWTKFILPEKKKKHEEEAIRKFLGTLLFNYLTTTKAFPQVQKAFDRAVAQIKFLGSLKEEVDLSPMAVYLGEDLGPLGEDEAPVDFTKDEFSFAMDIVQNQVIEEMRRKAEAGAGSSEEEQQNEAISAPGVEAGGVEVPPPVQSDSSNVAGVEGVGEPVSQVPENVGGQGEGQIDVPTQAELFAAVEWQEKS